MLESLMKKWKVDKKELFLILCVFAITGFTTAYVSKEITAWAGLTENSHWLSRLLLRLGVLIIGYQIILLSVAFLLGQFPFFWKYEKRILTFLRILKKEEGKTREDKKNSA